MAGLCLRNKHAHQGNHKRKEQIVNYLFLVPLALYLKHLASIGENEKREAKTKQKEHPTVTSGLCVPIRAKQWSTISFCAWNNFQPGLPNFHRNRLLNMIPLQFLTFCKHKAIHSESDEETIVH